MSYKLSIEDKNNANTRITVPAGEEAIQFVTNGTEVLKLSSKGSWVRGEQVDDKGVIYRMFKEWLSKAIMNQND